MLAGVVMHIKESKSILSLITVNVQVQALFRKHQIPPMKCKSAGQPQYYKYHSTWFI